MPEQAVPENAPEPEHAAAREDSAAPEDALAFEPAVPSKSARKRAAEAAQRLGETLITLKDADLVALDLPERLSDAIRAARGIKSRGAGARQRQYIGRLMREVDADAIRTALARVRARDGRGTRS
ncbi:MAG: ribosome biogenesis factor YjgA [Steroidobacteraceae bacterium]